MKILLIEDSRLLQTAIRRALTKAGHEVFIAGDGAAAIDQARKLMPDLILLDLMLPKITGTKVLKILRQMEETRNVPVFMLSGLSNKNQQKLIRAGAARYFEKSEALLKGNFAEVVEALATL